MLNLRLLFVALVWGINFSLVKFALEDFHPLGFTVLRFLLASCFLFCLVLASRESLFIARQDRFAVVKLGFIGITLYNLFFIYGLKFTTAANSALLISLSPLFGALIQAASGRERPNLRILSGLAFASFGVFLIIASHQGGLSFSSESVIGDLLTLCATITWALYTIMARPLLERYSAITVTTYAMAAGSVLLLPLSMAGLIGQSWAAISVPSWSVLAFAAFIAAGVAYAFWYQGVKQIGVTRTMAYHYLMPIAAVLFAALAFNEPITVTQIAGGIAILSGVYLVQGKAKIRS